MNIDHGYYLFLRGNRPLENKPVAWFAEIGDANLWASRVSCIDYEVMVVSSDEVRQLAQHKRMHALMQMAEPISRPTHDRK
jgi:hypothetical protein